MLKRAALLGFAAVLSAATIHSASAQGMGGWYVRGDLGGSFTSAANIEDRNFAGNAFGGCCIYGDAAGTVPGNLDDIGSGFFVGAGIGMRFTDQFRGDVTYTYRGGYSLDDHDQFAPPTHFDADIRSHSVMGNLYWDIPFSNLPVNPFVGVGIGWAGNTIDHIGAQNALYGIGQAPGGTTSSFAWQLMAGVSFQVANTFTMDLYYRYFNGGDIRSARGTGTLNGSSGAYSGVSGDLRAHEVGLSLRVPIMP